VLGQYRSTSSDLSHAHRDLSQATKLIDQQGDDRHDVSRRTLRRFWLLPALSLAAGVLTSTFVHPASAAVVSLCPDGTPPLTASQVITTPHGSKQYSYKAPPGAAFTDIVPSPSFNPATASADELAENNFAPRPASASALQDWTDQAEAYQGAYQVAPEWCFGNADSHNTGAANLAGSPTSFGVVQPESVSHIVSTFWSGYRDSAGGYQKVATHFSQPTVNNTTNAAMNSWVGLTGSGPKSVLIQAGTWNDVSDAAHGWPVWELYCPSSAGLSGCTAPAFNKSVIASGGQDVAMVTSYNPATRLTYYQVALAGKLAINVQYSLPSGANTGTDALFITKRVTGPPVRNIPAFTTMTWTSPRMYTVWNGQTPVSYLNQAVSPIVMNKSNSFSATCGTASTLMYPVGSSATSFYQQFCRAG